MVPSIELLIVSRLIVLRGGVGEHVPPICYVSLSNDKKPHTSVLAYLAGETVRHDITYLTHYYSLYTNKVGGRPPTSEMANETDDTPIAYWAQAPNPRPLGRHLSWLTRSTATAIVPYTTAMAQALQNKDKTKTIVITFYERMRKSNVPTF
ncbi:hypothetical protein M9H77_32467 [Catharanthus roseus]|uniref:Uncharacterized protein n=1 Tax=Catharanthus roseus TaxID=4058 RepID=A0ACC0A4W9_CATRO|nr:hypothetical protein M9H77_32467 [Catharanthus roseus]